LLLLPLPFPLFPEILLAVLALFGVRPSPPLLPNPGVLGVVFSPLLLISDCEPDLSVLVLSNDPVLVLSKDPVLCDAREESPDEFIDVFCLLPDDLLDWEFSSSQEIAETNDNSE
jgi:hypothetical protein